MKKAALLLLFVIISITANAQWSLTGNVVAGGNFLGSTNNQSLNFQTNNAQRMIVLGGLVGGATTGFVGIGTGFTTPLDLLDVKGGDIDVNTTTFGYKIADQYVVWHKGNPVNIFVGVLAGNANVGGQRNTFVGWSAGVANINGQDNVFVGLKAGYVNEGTGGTFASSNTFVGNYAAIANTTGHDNTFIGLESGFKNTTGIENTFVGRGSGGAIISGNYNTCLGNNTSQLSGSNTASYNTFVGYDAGHNASTGSSNTILGSLAGFKITTGQNNVISGWNAAYNITTGYYNVYSGWESAIANVSGTNNTYVGNHTGHNQLGSFCTFVGDEAGSTGDPLTNSLTNAAAIGSSAIARADNKMILGNNSVYVGIGLSNDIVQNGPQNKLEIDAGLNGFNPTTPGTVGQSGLRFRDLASNTSTIANPGTGVLSVNASGDVIYVPATGAAAGGYCGTATALVNNYEVPMNNFNYYYTDPTGILNDGVNFVKIGDNCSTPLTAKLQVHRGVTTNTQFQVSGSYTLNDDIAQSTVITGYGFGTSGEATGNNRVNSGVYGTSSDAATNSGGYFETSAAYVSTAVNATNYGVEAIANNSQVNTCVLATTSSSSLKNTGGSFSAMNATTSNVGVLGISGGPAAINAGGRFLVNSGTATNYGVYAKVPHTGSVEYAGYFDGDLFATGTSNCTSGIFGPSDRNLKQNFDSTMDAMAILNQLKPVKFDFKTNEYPQLRLPTGQQYGLIAQEVAAILPNFVIDASSAPELDSLGNITQPAVQFKSLNYIEFIPILIKGIQEQQRSIDSLNTTNHHQDSINNSLQTQLNTLRDMINSCCNNRSLQINNNGSNNSTTNSTSSVNVDLKDQQTVVLEQNLPNPFNEQTVINYFLPDNTGKAQMLFYNAQGRLIQTVELQQKGKGSINVFASDLSNGMYTYTLVVDGKVFETKKMLKQ